MTNGHHYECIKVHSLFNPVLRTYVAGMQVSCSCGVNGFVKLAHSVNAEKAKKKLEQQGWTVARKHATCPACTKGPASHG